jgi:trimethylamine--corrinoid protein Co-methyltransferase
MIPKFDVLTTEEVNQIHEKTMQILEEVGVEFTYDPAIAVFKEHGQRIEGHRVYFQRTFVEEMIRKAPTSFTLHARNPEKNVQCNHQDIIFTPSYGPPYIYEANGNRRYSTMNDYDNIVKLTGASTNIHATGGNVCEPTDVPDEIKHLKMLYSHIKNADKNFMGSAYGAIGAQDSIEMASILFGGRDQLKKNPALITLINSISPLKYDDRMLAALMTYAAAGQANLISALVMSGSTGPATMAGTITLQNAEVLAGIVLTQCINPGAPVIYGSSSAVADMRTVSLSIGNPETSLYTAASAQMARFYGVPSRGGGGLNDSIAADAQAGYEAMMVLMSAALSGINYVLHAAGIMHYYSAFSYEKFIIDDEIAGMVLKYLKGFDFSEEMFVKDDIKEVGPGGHYLYQASTLNKHRQELRIPVLSSRVGYEAWDTKGRKDTNTRAQERWRQILATYEAPALDEAMEKELCTFVEKRSQELLK